ncbi:hypothetical protein BDF20DRAFT_812481, partial [Mycotypha africana]|uniref:uncharacterized protein n=1 Tax=Mycotypha africana TaxID=64632 RepID=UPI0023000BAD
RKLPIDSAVLPTFREKFRERVISCCNDIRAIVFRSQLFVNAYLIHNKKDTPKEIFTQQFWYSVGQLVTGKTVTNKKAINDSMKNFYKQFKEKHPAVEVSYSFTKGYSQCLTEACKELSTTYTNSIVELFEQRMLKYLYYTLQNLFPSMVKRDIDEIATKYCYQAICKGEPKWPGKVKLSSDDKLRIDNLCKNFADLVEEKVTLLSLAADPVKFVKPLWFIQDYYEEEHSNHFAYDVRRLPLPHRFFPFPTPSVSWRFITISINALTPFLFPGRLVKGYWNQLEQFCKVFNFKKLGFRR